MPKTLVLDLRLPARRRKDVEAKPDEATAFVAGLHEAQKDTGLRTGWDRLLKKYDADDVWFQAYRQDPRHPFKHERPHASKGLTSDQPDPDKEPEQATGRSGLLVATLHIPRRDSSARSEDEMSKHTVGFLTELQDLLRPRIDGRNGTYGYRALNARGQEYDDLSTVKHNSFSCSVSVSCSVGQLISIPSSIEFPEPDIPLPSVG